jgi:hypothetical protein
MFKNYLKIAFRNIKRHLGYSFINIFGLSVGLACCILILLWIREEVSFNKFHENIDDLYVEVTTARFGDETITYPGSPPAFGPAVKQEYPEILNTARFDNGTATMVLAHEKKMYREEVQIGDPSILEMFSFPLIKGDRATALARPHSMVMTERMAEKYFGNDEPVGQIIRVDDTYDFEVTGILKNIPSNSSIRFDFLVPLSFFNDLRGPRYLTSWGNLSFRTYVLLEKNVDFETVSQKIADRLVRQGEKDIDVFLHPFSRLYLYWLDTGGGRIEKIHLFTLIAFNGIYVFIGSSFFSCPYASRF